MRERIKDAILRSLSAGPLTVSAIAEQTGEKPTTIRRRCAELWNAGKVKRVSYSLNGPTTWALKEPKEKELVIPQNF